MRQFDNKYFQKTSATQKQIDKALENAKRDLNIAKEDRFLIVRFNYAYMALLKCGTVLLQHYLHRVRSVPGHHVKILEKMSEFLEDEDIMTIGNIMRSKRNRDLYDGGIEVTEKECNDFVEFAEKVFMLVQNHINSKE